MWNELSPFVDCICFGIRFQCEFAIPDPTFIRSTFFQSLNQVIIWDKIVKSPQEAILKEKNEFVKYALIDQGQELRYVLACFKSISLDLSSDS